jgi:AraC-like DNA-binding protein
MIYIPTDLIQFVFVPLISAHLLLMVLIYFVFVRRQALVNVYFAGVFLISFIVFLLGKGLQSYTDLTTAYIILYSRVCLLFSVGIPSLLLLNLSQQNILLSMPYRLLFFMLGFIFSIIYVVSMDASVHQIFFDQSFALFIPFPLAGDNALVMGVLILTLLPCLYLLYREYSDGRQRTRLVFLFGSLSFSVLLIIGWLQQSYWLYYIGSIITALCWSWAMYQDIKLLKGEAQLLKDEVHMLLRSGNKNIQPAVNKLLMSLESHAHGNLEHYKLKIRDSLNLLTDTTINAGGDSYSLLTRNSEKIAAVKLSDDVVEIRKIASEEAATLTDIIADIPVKRSAKIVEQTIKTIEERFDQNIEAGALATSVNVSESYLMRNFKKETGQTIKQFLTHCRIKKAKKLLLDHSVSDTAFAVGYNNSNYFSTVFKKSMDLTPQQYQKNNE